MAGKTIAVLAIDDRSIQMLENKILKSKQYTIVTDKLPKGEPMLTAYIEFFGVNVKIRYFTIPILYCDIQIKDITVMGYEMRKFMVKENEIVTKPMLDNDMNVFIASGFESTRILLVNFLSTARSEFIEKIVDRESCVIDNNITSLSIIVKKIECDQVVLLNEIENAMNKFSLQNGFQ